MVLTGCAGARRPPATPAAGAAEALPWELPAAAYPSQRLYRLHYDGPEGEGALRLVLRLAGPDRYRLTIADRLGRPLYTLDSGDGGGLLLDHRERLACPLDPDLRLPELPLESLPLSSLPAVLLGRVPAAPARGERPEPGAPKVSYRDAQGRRWSAEAGGAGGAPVSWILWQAGEPVVWWRRAGGESLLSDRRRGVQMAWRETGAEPLTQPLPRPAAPDGYAPAECGSI